MNASEQAQLRLAIKALWDNEYETGMRILCKLADMTIPALDIQEIREVSVFDIGKREAD